MIFFRAYYRFENIETPCSSFSEQAQQGTAGNRRRLHQRNVLTTKASSFPGTLVVQQQCTHRAAEKCPHQQKHLYNNSLLTSDYSLDPTPGTEHRYSNPIY